MAECLIREEVCKTPREVKPWGFNFALWFSRKWKANTNYAAAVALKPSKKAGQTGYQYSSSGGVSGAVEPRWPTAKDIAAGKNTVRDGSITWTAQAITADSLVERITAATWTVEGGITFAETPIVDEATDQSTGGRFSGGTLEEKYLARVVVETDEGNEYEALLVIEIEEGEE